MDATWISYGRHMDIIWTPHGHHMDVFLTFGWALYNKKIKISMEIIKVKLIKKIQVETNILASLCYKE